MNTNDVMSQVEINKRIIQRYFEAYNNKNEAIFDEIIAPDSLQFHWWDYDNPYYMDALKFLSDLRDEGIIKHICLKF